MVYIIPLFLITLFIIIIYVQYCVYKEEKRSRVYFKFNPQPDMTVYEQTLLVAEPYTDKNEWNSLPDSVKRHYIVTQMDGKKIV